MSQVHRCLWALPHGTWRIKRETKSGTDRDGLGADVMGSEASNQRSEEVSLSGMVGINRAIQEG